MYKCEPRAFCIFLFLELYISSNLVENERTFNFWLLVEIQSTVSFLFSFCFIFFAFLLFSRLLNNPLRMITQRMVGYTAFLLEEEGYWARVLR